MNGTAGLQSGQPSALGRFVALVTLWHRRAIERRALAGFDDRQLKDIGINPFERARECGKVFWRG